MRRLPVIIAFAATALGLNCSEPVTITRLATTRSNDPTSLVGEDAWSEPVWLGPVVNSAARDWRPVLSTDGHELYFHSDRTGGLGGFDIYVSHRDGPGCPWQAPVNLGPPINTTGGDGDPAFMPGDRAMFFGSSGHDGAGQGDIFVSRRANPGDDSGWEPPVNLGPYVNTPAHESNPWYVASEAGGTLYFERGPGTNPQISDIFKVEVSRDGEVLGPAVLISELSDASGPHVPSVSGDGRELIFWSGGAGGTRPGSVGLADVWVSTRQSPNDSWSTPQNLGAPVNTTVADLSSTLSHDGRTLFITSVRPGGLGLQDLWMSTREPGDEGRSGTAERCGS